MEPLEFLVQKEPSFRRGRLPALYSDFTGQKTTNPDAYEANVSAWRKGLASLTYAGLASDKATSRNCLILNADESLIRALESKQYGRPLALGAAIQDGIIGKDLMPLQQFQAAKDSIYTKTWASLPGELASRVLRQIGLAGTDKMPNAPLVVMSNLEAASGELMRQTEGLSTRAERTCSKTGLKSRKYAQIMPDGQSPLSDADLDVLLKFMSRDKGLLLYDGKTVKFNPVKGQETQITPDDEAIASLTDLSDQLTHQISILTQKIEQVNVSSKEAVLRKDRISALAALKSKKMAEASLQKRLATLAQVGEIQDKIEEASDNVQLVKAMDSSAAVLESLNKEMGGVEKVDAAVDRMREQMTQADEVNTILAESEGVADDAEIDSELEAMEAAERRKVEEAEAEQRKAQQAAESVRQREEAQRTAARLSEVEPVPQSKEPVTAAANGVQRLSLEEQPQAEAAE